MVTDRIDKAINQCEGRTIMDRNEVLDMLLDLRWEARRIEGMLLDARQKASASERKVKVLTGTEPR